MKKTLILLPIISVLIISFVLSYPIHIKPKDGSGNLQPSTAFNYTFNFTTASDCSGVLLTNSSTITTGVDGTGFIDINLSTLNTQPNYLCEYRDGSLRAVHIFPESITGRTFNGGNVSVNNSNFFVNTNNGYVGIGTTSPQSLLNVGNGSFGIATGLTFGDGDSGIYENADDSLVLSPNSGGTYGYINLINEGVTTYPVLRIYSDTGAIGSAERMDIWQQGVYSVIDARNTGGMQFRASGSTKMAIEAGGNVGIGTTTPAYALEVKKVDNALNVSGVLYVNGTSGSVGVGNTTFSNGKFEIVGNVSNGELLTLISDTGNETSPFGATVDLFAIYHRNSSDGTLQKLFEIDKNAAANVALDTDQAQWGFKVGGTPVMFLSTSVVYTYYNFKPGSDNSLSLGASGLRFMDLFMSRNSYLPNLYGGFAGNVSLFINSTSNKEKSSIYIGGNALVVNETLQTTSIKALQGDLTFNDTYGLILGNVKDVKLQFDGTTTNFTNSVGANNLNFLMNGGNVSIMNGNVGIGTASPGYKLDVKGGTFQAIQTYFPTGNEGSYLRLMNSNNWGGYIGYNYNGGYPEFVVHKGNSGGTYSASNIGFLMDINGNVGIGTTTPAYNLEVKKVHNALNVSGVLYVNGTSGNVGIGTATPNATLHTMNMFMIQGNSTAMTCDVNHAGGIYYDGTLNTHYGCNSTDWNALY